MGMFKKIFGNESTTRSAGSTFAQLEDPDTGGEQAEKSGHRRELVQVVLRDTLRQHGIPLDWIECRTLAVMSRNLRPGLHVQLVVRQGHERMLVYVPAFQSSFMANIEKFEARVSDWLFSLSWQFDGISEHEHPAMPRSGQWAAVAAPKSEPPVTAAAGATTSDEDEVMEDLKALFAIRDASLEQDPNARPGDHQDSQPTQPTQPGR